MRKVLALFLALLLSGWCNLALAAIAVEGDGSAGVVGGVSSSFAVQCGTNPNRYLFIGTYLESPIAEISALTYAGVDIMSSFITDGRNAGNSLIGIWGVVAPASGSNTLAFTSDTSTNIVVIAICLSDVDQSTPRGTVVSANAVTVDVTVATDGMAVDFMTYGAVGGGSYTQGAGQTLRELRDNGDDSIEAAISTEVAVGTVTMSWTEVPPACCYTRIVAVPLNKAAAAATRRPIGPIVY